MAVLRHVVVARNFRAAALYAEKNGWASREWTWTDSVDRIRGLQYITVYIMETTWHGYNVDPVKDIRKYLMQFHEVYNIAVTEVAA